MMSFFSTFFLSFFILATANLEMPQDTPPPQDMFNEILMRTGMNLQDVARKRPHRLKNMNDSIAALAAAMRGMASGEDGALIMQKLEMAKREYSENPMALLLQGVIAGTTGDITASNRYLEEFLIYSKRYTEFEKSFIPWDPYHRLRRMVYELLHARGINFEGREKEIHMKIPFEALMQYVKNPAPKDEALNLFFIIFISLGTISIFLAKMRGAEFQSVAAQTLFYTYLAAWIAYGVWFCDLAVGLPGRWNRFDLVPIIMGIPLLWGGMLFGYNLWRRFHAEIEEGYRKCPHCKAVIQELLVECPECRKKIT